MAEELLTSTSMILYIVIEFLVYFPIGYLLLNDRMKSVPFIMKIPIFLSLGMVTVVIVMIGVGIFYIGNLVFPVIAFVSYAFFIAKLRLNGQMGSRNILASIRSMKLSYFVSFTVIVLVISHFSIVAGYIGWPPQGDALTHGLLTTLLIHNGRLQSNLSPIDPTQPWHEPIGLHTLAANLSLTFQAFPGISIFVISTTAITLILLLIYSIVYVITRSVVFAIIALVAGFYIPSINSLEYWIVGYYYNGPYANLFGYLSLIVYVAVQFAVPSLDYKKKPKITIPTIISIIGILLIYPPLSLLPIIHLLGFWIIINGRRIWKYFHFALIKRKRVESRSTRKVVITLSTASASIIAGIAASILFGVFQQQDYSSEIFSPISTITTILDRLQRFAFFYSLPFDIFIADITGGFLTVLTSGAAIISILRGKYVYLSTFYLLTSVIVTLSTWDRVSEYFWFTLPRRLFVFLYLLNWIVILTYLNPVITWLTTRTGLDALGRTKFFGRNITMYICYVIIIIPLSILLLPHVYSQASLEQASTFGWFPRSESFRNNFDMVVWVSKNINSKDLIMVDNSFTSLFISSMSLKNLTAIPISPAEQHYTHRLLENQIPWERPELLREFVRSHDVKYVLLLEGPIEYGATALGGEGKYHVKKYNSIEYQRMFDTMPFLKPIRRDGVVTLYEVK